MPLYPRLLPYIVLWLAAFPCFHAYAATEPSVDPHAGHIMPDTPRHSDASQTGHVMPDEKVPADKSTATPLTINPPQPATFPLNTRGTPPPEVVERLGEHVPAGIVMTDEHGKNVDVRGLLDRPTLILPIFLSCPAGCNTLQSAMAAALPGVNLMPGKDFRVISLSFDEDDTPEQALRKKADYMAAMNFQFPEDGWIFLTGDKENIKRFTDALGFPFIRLGPGNFSHPLAVIATGPDGKIARYMYGQGFLPFDLNMALNEAALGKTGLSIKRMLAYCFTYDPEARGYVFNFMRVAGVIIIFGLLVFLAILILGGKKRRRTPS